MKRHLIRIALGVGLVLFALFASSVIGWKFHHDPALGRALFGWIYPPWSAVGWWYDWGRTPPYYPLFMQALNMALILVVLPVMGVQLVRMYGSPALQMKLFDNPEEEQSGLGKPGALRKSGHIRHRGPGIVLGRGGSRVYRSGGDRHACVLGGSGARKTTTHAITTAAISDQPMLIIDPSGDIAKACRTVLTQRGPLHIVDPTKRTSARCNPILEMPPAGDDRLIGACQMAAALLTNAGKGHGPKDPFWDESAGYLVSGLLCYARCSDDPTLAHVWRLLVKIGEGTYPTDADGFAKDVLLGFSRQEQKLRDSMVSTARAHLKFLADPIIQNALSASDFRASDLQAADRPVTIAITIPEDQAERLRPLTRLYLQSLIKPLMHDRRLCADGRRKRQGVQTLVMVDDFPALGYMELIEDGLADARKYGLRFLLLGQTVEQIHKHYGINQSILGNCATVCVTPGLSKATLDTVIAWAGKHGVLKTTRQRQGMKTHTSYSMSWEPVLNARELLERADEEVLVFTPGCAPTYLKKIWPWQDRTFMHLLNDPDEEPQALLALPAPTYNDEGMPPWLTMRTR